MRTKGRSASIVLVTLLALVSVTQADPTTLTNNVPVTNLSGDPGSWTQFQFDVPSSPGAMEVTLSGGTGDCDLYVRYGSTPTLTEWDYLSDTPTNNDSVTVINPTVGTWDIGLYGYYDYCGATLTCTFTPQPTPPIPAPAALVLGAFGSGLAAWVKRRRLL